eukprot:scaffold42956_cov17-Tisochrysis_lutea.AAC.1
MIGGLADIGSACYILPPVSHWHTEQNRAERAGDIHRPKSEPTLCVQIVVKSSQAFCFSC